MISQTIVCARCDGVVDGFYNEDGTTGYYDVRLNHYWSKYGKDNEEYLCDHCMWQDEEYLRDYPTVD